MKHDFLWRVNKALPPRGTIAIFNRSYYEDVLVVQVHDLQKTYQMADRVLGESKKAFFKKRYRQIRNYEEYLFDNSYRIVKIFLNISKKEQKKRFLERIDNPAKNWKFSSSDLAERAHFDEYLDVYADVIDATATPESLVSEIVLDALQQCSHAYPQLDAAAQAALKDCRTQLEAE